MKRQIFAGAFALGILMLALPTAVPAQSSSTGTWACTASGEGPNGDQIGHFTLVLKESSGTVTGTYYDGAASLTGSRSGNTVTGTYKEKSGPGVFTFVFSGDGKSFTGTWGVNAGQTGGTWSGTRQ
jgi:hypothetical protein